MLETATWLSLAFFHEFPYAILLISCRSPFITTVEKEGLQSQLASSLSSIDRNLYNSTIHTLFSSFYGLKLTLSYTYTIHPLCSKQKK